MWILAVLGALALVALTVSYVCFSMAFLARRPKESVNTEQIDIPEGRIYEAYRPKFERWAREVRAMPCRQWKITSYDGLPLYGKFYEYAPNAPVEIMFHGYRGSAERDLSGGVQRSFSLGHSALIVDQRCSGKSGGKVITFGIREHRDALAWAWFAYEKLGAQTPVILTGISMGASTVVTAAGKELPSNVVGVLADCGFSSAKDIIQTVIKKMGLPPKLAYPFVKLGAWLFGGFDLEEITPVEALQNCKVPVIFFHGEADDFVPCDMSLQMYEACPTRKRLVTVPGAGHGLACPADTEGYIRAVREFFHS